MRLPRGSESGSHRQVLIRLVVWNVWTQDYKEMANSQIALIWSPWLDFPEFNNDLSKIRKACPLDLKFTRSIFLMLDHNSSESPTDF